MPLKQFWSVDGHVANIKEKKVILYKIDKYKNDLLTKLWLCILYMLIQMKSILVPRPY